MKIERFPCDAAGAVRLAAVAGTDRLTPADAQRQRPGLSLVAGDAAGDRACASVWWQAVPRIAGHWVGVVGHYAAADAGAGAAVLAAACEALREHGATLAVGPMDADTWHRYRLVTWRAADPPFLQEPDNPDTWPGHFEQSGFAPLAGYHSACCDDLVAVPADEATAARLRGQGFRLRSLDPARLDADLHLLWVAACDAFAGNFLYTPLAEDDFRHLYAPAIASVPPRMVTIAERAGHVAGFLLSYPDALQAARGERVDTVVLKTLGVVAAARRGGLGRLLFDRAVASAREAGFRRGILALIHDDNPSARFAREQRRLIRRYTLFARPL
jgi:ribosomal protein S18 acetylase RimI-like enzyme